MLPALTCLTCHYALLTKLPTQVLQTHFVSQPKIPQNLLSHCSQSSITSSQGILGSSSLRCSCFEIYFVQHWYEFHFLKPDVMTEKCIRMGVSVHVSDIWIHADSGRKECAQMLTLTSLLQAERAAQKLSNRITFPSCIIKRYSRSCSV